MYNWQLDWVTNSKSLSLCFNEQVEAPFSIALLHNAPSAATIEPLTSWGHNKLIIDAAAAEQSEHGSLTLMLY